MANILFVVWRESVEALLVIGILFAWLRNAGLNEGMKYLWGGVVAGLALAGALAGAMMALESVLPDGSIEYFQLAMVLIASGLIVQMVFWMRIHGRTLKKELEGEMSQAAAKANWWGLMVVVMLAVAREGSEAVVFLYGLGLGSGSPGQTVLAIVLGLALAFLTFWLLQQGGKIFSWRLFFKITEIMLLFLAASMLINGVERMIGLDWIPGIVDPLWNTSMVLDDTSRFGGVVGALTGYRAQPALTMVLVYAAYWIAVVVALKRVTAKQNKPKPAPVAAQTASQSGR
ncbi:FTR1 family iron permease [Silvimonas amylolytica]|uniref:Iron transporter OFeT family protein n=1 Tax=Silvimonas amylolytica TaxID=449663 RepID=A0ABQ2PPJ4_9NEIS|nr:FTR1 family protein [Silvimonas amylolytica]GGP27325.1 iron transporter OFeT family protein [Silvimonas amylolytica]